MLGYFIPLTKVIPDDCRYFSCNLDILLWKHEHWKDSLGINNKTLLKVNCISL